MGDEPGWPGGFPLLPHPGELVFGLLSGVAGLLPLVAVGVVVLLWLRTRRPRVPTSTAQATAAAGTTRPTLQRGPSVSGTPR